MKEQRVVTLEIPVENVKVTEEGGISTIEISFNRHQVNPDPIKRLLKRDFRFLPEDNERIFRMIDTIQTEKALLSYVIS